MNFSPYALYIKALAVLIVAGCLIGATHHFTALSYEKEMTAHLLADAKQQAQDLRNLVKIAEKVRAQEHALAAANAAAGEQYEKGKQDAEAAGKRVADDLRAGNLKLRKEWRGCEVRVPDPAAGASQPDDAAERRASGTGHLVGATHDDAEKIKALQDLLRAERK